MSHAAGRTARRRERRCFDLLLVLLLLLPLPLGANRPWLWPLFAAATFVLAAVVFQPVLAGTHAAAPALRRAAPGLWLLAAWCAFGALQLIPLPGLDRAGATISIEPGASAAALLQTLFLVALFALVLQLTASRRRLAMLLGLLLAAGLFQAAYGALMTLSGVELGVFGPKAHGRGVATGTFVNRNHLAGFLELCLAAGLGLLIGQLDDRPPPLSARARLRSLVRAVLGPKMVVRLALAVMVIALVLTRSRMGNTAFFASVLITGALALALIPRPPRRLVLLLVSLLAVDVLIIGTWFGFEQVVDRIQETGQYDPARDRYRDQERLDVDVETLAAWADHRWLGSGGGTFYVRFPAYRPGDVGSFFDHAHNDYLEFLLEYGVIGTALLAAFALLTLTRALGALRRRRDRLLRGASFAAVMAWTALAIHASVDFNLRIPANAAYLMVCLALAWLAAGMPGRARLLHRVPGAAPRSHRLEHARRMR